MPDPKIKLNLDLSDYKEESVSGELDLDLSDYNSSQKKKSTPTSTPQKSGSGTPTGSSGGKNSSGFPKIDMNSVAPGYGEQPDYNAINLAKSKRVKELETSFYASTKDNTDDAVAEQRLQDRKANKGFWNTAEDLTKSAYNKVVGGISSLTDEPGIRDLKISEDPLADEKKQALLEAKKNKITLTEAQKNSRAEEIFKQKEKDNLFIDRANSYLDNLDVKDKDILEQSRLDKSTHLQLENQKKFKVVSAMETVGNEKIKEYQAVEKQLLDLKKNGQEFPKELYDKYSNLGVEINQISGNIQKYSDQIQKNKSDLGTIEQEYDLFKRGYGDMDNFMGNAIATSGELANGIFGAVNYFASLSPDPITRLNSMRGQEIANKISGKLEEYRGALRKPVESVESAEGFVNYASDLVANQLPVLAVTSTGAGGLATLGASTTGQTFTKINQEVLTGKANYSPLQMAAIPLLQGGFEVISEIPTLSILKKGSRVISAAANGEIDLIKKSGGEIFKGYAKDFGKEFGGEHITNLGQNFNARYVQGKEDVGLLDNTGRVSKDTAFLTTLLQGSPHVFGAVAKVFQSNQDFGTLDENSRKIIEFSKQLNTEGLTDTEKTVIQKQIDKVTAESSKISANTIGKIGDMPNVSYDEIVSLNSQAGKLKSQAKEIKDGKLPNKEALLTSLGQDYKELQTKRNGLIDGSITPFDLLSGNEQAKRLTQASREITKRDNPDGTKEKFEVKPEDAKKLATENYLKEIKEKDIVDDKQVEQTPPTPEAQPQAEVPQQAEAEKVETREAKIEREYQDAFQKIEFGDDVAWQKLIDERDSKLEALKTKETPKPQEVSPVEDVVATSVAKEPKIVVHATVDGRGFALNHSEGIESKDIIEPKDARGSISNEDQIELNKGNSVVQIENTDKNGDKEISIVAPMTDFAGRSGSSVYEFTIDKNSKANAEGINEVITKIHKFSENTGKELIDETVKAVKDYLKQNEATPETNTPTNGNVQLGASNVGESGNAEPKTPAKKSVPSSVDGGEVKGDVEVSPFAEFEKIVNESKSVDEAFDKIKNIKGVSSETSKSFRDKYDPKGDLSIKEAFGKFYDEVKAKSVETTQVENKQKPTTKERIAERIKLSDAKIDADSDVVKAKIKAFMDMFPSADINPDDYHTNGFSADAIIDMVAKATKSLMEAGIRMDEAIKQAIEGYNTHFDDKIDPKAVEERINPKKEADNGFKREKGKSSVLKRIREGGNSPEINDIIDKIGLNYEGRKQEQVYADGVNFVKEVGIAEAYNAIKNGELKDSDTINVVYATILQGFPKMAENEISKVSDPQELSDLVKELDDLHEKIYTEFKAKTIDAGRGSAILNFIYNQDLKIRYSLSQQIENFKKVNNGVVPPEALAKMKELDKQYQEANKRIEELETLLQEAQEQKDFENIVEEEKRNGDFKYTQEDFDKELQKSIDNIKNDIKNEKKSLANKKREDVLTPKEKSRKQELRNKYFRANDITSIPALLVDPEFREYLGLVLKQAKGDFKIFSKEMLDTLGKVAKTHLPDLFKEAQNESSKKIGKLTVDEDDNISIPNSLIRSLVEQGFDDIKKLTSKILSDNKEEFPELTERKIRDAITKYGKTVEPNNVDPAPLIRKIKRAGKAISAIEDIAKGIRPKRSGLQRDKLDPEERRILRDINESMKNLPLDKADLSKHLKTALDAIKTRLSNHIEDLNKQIAEGKKWSKDKSSIELDQDAKDLVAKRDSLKIALDELVNVPKTEDEIYNERIASKLAEREKVLQGLIEGKKNDPTGRKSDWSAEISKVNTEISRLREKQKAIQSQKTPDEIYQKEIEAKINSLQKRIDDVKTGKVKDTEGNSSVWNSEISALETELKNLKDGKKVVNNPKVKVTVDKNGKVRIPAEMIKDFISKGGTDLSEFAKQVQESIKDEFPDVTVRDIRESVANYGKKANKSRPQIVEDIQKLKSEERLMLEFEDLQNRISKEKNEVKKRALTQTQKRLKEQIKQLQDDLGVTETERTNRSVNYTKKRIEILREKIKNNDFAKKEIKPIVESQELKEAKIEKNRVQEEFDYLSYQQEIENRTFGDKAAQLASDLYDAQRVTLATGEASFVGAQGHLYMIHTTFSRKTLKNLVENFKGTTAKEWKSNPFGTALKMIKSASSAEAIIKMINTMGTANNYMDSQRLLKESPDYDLYLKMGLRLLGEDVKTQVKDDNFIGNNILTLLKVPIHLIDRVEKKELMNLKLSLAETEKKRTTLQGYYEKLKTGKVSDKNKKTATEIFNNANPLATFERGNNTFMNFARKDLADIYIAELRAQGKNPIDHLDDFKKVGSAINTITGSGNMNQTVTIALPILNKTMFSARYFAASWNLTPPMSLYYLAKLGNYDGMEINKPGTWKTWKPTVAQKAFVKPMMKGFLAMYGVSLATMALINAAIDDDDEMTEEEKAKKRAYIEYDPRSSNFMQVNSGNTHTDFFGPYRGNVVFMSKILSGQSKNREGKIIENGSEYGSRTDFQIGAEYLAGKANPTLGVPLRYWQGSFKDVVNEETGEKERKRMLFNDEVGIGYQIKHNTYPIFIKTVKAISDEDPVLGSAFYNTLAFFGKNTNVYKTPKAATPEQEFLKKQEKIKEYNALPQEEKDKVDSNAKIPSLRGAITEQENMKYAIKTKTPYYVKGDSEPIDLSDITIAEIDETIADLKKSIEEMKKEAGDRYTEPND